MFDRSPIPRLRRLAALLAALGAAAAVQAAPVDARADLVSADPFELAERWTVASLVPAGPGGRANAPARAPEPAAPRFSALPQAAAEGGVPTPGAYALMGLALLGAGLAARRLNRRQRGFSKKT